ncbi:MAG: diphthine--ammonia ligase [Sulfolobales archaeon]
MKRAVALYSGGKDSHYSILLSYYRGIITDALVVVLPRRDDSWLFHAVNTSWSRLHGDAMGIPVHIVPVSGIRDVELSELRDGLSKILREYPHVDYIITGAVKSRYQLERFKAVSEELGLELYAPLWNQNEVELLKSEVKDLSFIITAVQAYCLSPHILGNPSGSEILHYLITAHKDCGVSLVGEGGEFETYVIGSPLFKGRGIAISKARMVLYPNQHTGYYVIENAGLL